MNVGKSNLRREVCLDHDPGPARGSGATAVVPALVLAALVMHAVPVQARNPMLLSRAGLAGDVGDSPSYGGSIAGDGSRVTFESSATNLDPGNDGFDTYVKNPATGAAVLVYGHSGQLSGDGRRMVFTTLEADDDFVPDDYVIDLVTSSITRVSENQFGQEANDSVWGGNISADGNRVVFMSDATNLVYPNLAPGSGYHLYVKDLTTGDVFIGPSGISYSLSRDGTRVAFVTDATNLDPADTDTVLDVYVRDLTTSALTLVSRAGTAGPKGNAASPIAVISADGKRVVFQSRATNIHPDRTTGGLDYDVFVKDLATGELTLVSRVGATGEKSNGSSEFPHISAGGNIVAFDSNATNLDPALIDSHRQVYVKDLTTGKLTLVSRIGGGGSPGNHDSVVGRLNADGTTVLFTSEASNFEPADTNNTTDVYLKKLRQINRRLKIKDDAADATKRQIQFAAPDPLIDTTAGTGIDPVTGGAWLQVYNASGTGESVCLPLPASGWTASGAAPNLTYSYKDTVGANGPCRSATAKDAKLLSVKCDATVQPINYTLNESSQGAMGVRFTSGTTTYCAVFGGQIKKDSGTDPPVAGGKGLFVATQGQWTGVCQPAACP